MRRLAAILALLLVAVGAVTWTALEGGEVAVLHTQVPGGEPHATRVWIADEDGNAWVEAATPERPFYRDLLARPALEVERGGRRVAMRAEPVPGSEGHVRVRELLRAKYGAADVWINLLVDTSRSVAVRLVPAS